MSVKVSETVELAELQSVSRGVRNCSSCPMGWCLSRWSKLSDGSNFRLLAKVPENVRRAESERVYQRE